ncbi:carbonic anhydrase [Blastopirellula marina]|uniref:Carbonic anhydrase n=1 Tax=Blastopirellula marina TaxID=124 RepID=A0A2S8GD67_9BACT|nr:carbonic anhydrase [Blastopirellula marina]PQO42379.1 carbonic anhydrase [Blastopirellula marina]
MRDLLGGVARFQQKAFPRLRSRFEQLARGQQPDALFITCSDSRVDPTLITNCRPGELFVISNAGNIVGSHDQADLGVAATIEYAVKELEVSQIIVCGHSRCGAMGGLLDPQATSSLPRVSEWVATAKEALVDATSNIPNDRLAQLIQANVRLQLRNLMTFPEVAEAVEARRLVLKGWVYDFVTGSVEVLSTDTNKFAPPTSHQG